MDITNKINQYLNETKEIWWNVWIKNNYYNGKYADYSARPFRVKATSEEEAKQYVLDNADEILQKLINTKNNGRSILPKSSALKITEKLIGRIEKAKILGK